MMKQSRPSPPRNLPKDPKHSTTSWPIPEPGDVISYAFLWHREAEFGQEEGLKDRPTVVVVAQEIVNGRVRLMVAPITHAVPDKPDTAIALPVRVKSHLGLDRDRSWVILDELNRFVWPGPDVRAVGGSAGSTPLYGAIPSDLFDQIKAEILKIAKKDQVTIVKRRP
jgi:hypothetical protein